jgi:hypothetical protein
MKKRQDQPTILSKNNILFHFNLNFLFPSFLLKNGLPLSGFYPLVSIIPVFMINSTVLFRIYNLLAIFEEFVKKSIKK